jgi:hypothetical protein
MAPAIGVKAVQNGINALFIDADDLIEWMRQMKDTAWAFLVERHLSARVAFP